ncbi:MAG: hypothetical protein HY721_25125 [Planctomycetes bacterium]|nr:hypothetical protein [Planctomycetota bacterium]
MLAPVLAPPLALLLAACGGGGSSGTSAKTSIDPPPSPEPPGELPAFPFTEHLDQARVTSGGVRFRELFTIGDELFETRFNALDGVGALRLPDGTALPGRFSRVPPGGGRFTGPNGQACAACHDTPFGTSAGDASANVAQDPAGAGQPPFNQRNTTSLFGAGLLQRLAEEMTEDLLALRDQAAAQAALGGPAVAVALVTKGVSFGSIAAVRDAGGDVTFDASGVEGVSPDLVVRPFGWKGNVASLRDFVRGAALNELGMEADELVAKDSLGRSDPDGDDVEGELSVGDITAITVYVAAQETPTTVARRASAGRSAPPGEEFAAASRRGEEVFSRIGCAGCHVPELRLEDPVFEEPTSRAGGSYLDGDIDPAVTLLDPSRPFRFDLARQGDFPRPEPHPEGGLRVRLFGDLKRHRMGSELSDAQETPVSVGTGEQLEVDGVPQTVVVSELLTAELWGAGSTGPWLHDGRAGSLEEAALLHGTDDPPPEGDPDRSEAQEERDAFAALSAREKEDLVTFLKSLILFEAAEE